jgi:hypothetical protein
VSDLGGSMRSTTGHNHRKGGNCCVVKTLGALLSVHGYPEDVYLQAAKTEFARTDVPPEQRGTNERFLTMLTGSPRGMTQGAQTTFSGLVALLSSLAKLLLGGNDLVWHLETFPAR